MAVLTSLVIIYVMPLQYVPGFAECHALDGFPLHYFFKGSFMVTTTVLMIAINVYLYNKIHETSARYREGKQLSGHGVHLRKETHLDTLKSRLHPSCFLVGWICYSIWLYACYHFSSLAMIQLQGCMSWSFLHNRSNFVS